MVDQVEVIFAAFFGLLLVVALWKRYRSEAGTRTLPILEWWLVSTLVRILPKIVWPTAERVHRVTGFAGVLITVVVAVVAFRRGGRLETIPSPDSAREDLRT